MGPKEKEIWDVINNAAEELNLGADVNRCKFVLLCDKESKGE